MRCGLLPGCGALISALLSICIALFLSSSLRVRIAPKVVLDDGVPQPLLPNHDLAPPNVEQLFVDRIRAPEDFASKLAGQDANDIVITFASLGDGTIAKIEHNTSNNQCSFSTFVRTGEDLPSCGELRSEPRCGRPLGMQWTKAGAHYQQYLDDIKDGEEVLLVADAYKGLLLVSESGSITVLASEAAGTPIRFANSVAVHPNGDVYFTDSSSRFQRNEVILETLEAGTTGRLLRFLPQTGKIEVVLNSLAFPNGIVISDGGDSVLVALSNRYKLIKVWLNSSVVQVEDWSSLPGNPDNLSLLNLGARYGRVLAVAIAVPRPLGLYGQFIRLPIVRTLISMLPASLAVRAVKKCGLLALLDEQSGETIRVLQDPTGTTYFVSGSIVLGNFLYLGSWEHDVLTRIPIDKL